VHESTVATQYLTCLHTMYLKYYIAEYFITNKLITNLVYFAINSQNEAYFYIVNINLHSTKC